MDAEDWRVRITVDPAVLAGKPTVRGLRVSVEQVLRMLASGIGSQEIMEDYPDLEPGDLGACLRYAAEAVASERIYPVLAGG